MNPARNQPYEPAEAPAVHKKHSAFAEWFQLYGMNLAVLPYFAIIWAFTNYVGVISTPWTIGWIMLWLIYSPLMTWSAIYVIGNAIHFFTVCFVGLVVAVPFWPDAKWMLVTVLASIVLCAPQLWTAIAVFVAIVCGIYIWYHGGIGL